MNKKSTIMFLLFLMALYYLSYISYISLGSNELSDIASVFSILGGASTVVASIFAISTFSDWKEQRQKDALIDFDKKMIISALIMVEEFGAFMYYFSELLSENPEFDNNISMKFKNRSKFLMSPNYDQAIIEYELAIKEKQEFISSSTIVVRAYSAFFNKFSDSKNACNLCKITGHEERMKSFERLNYICRNLAQHAMDGNIKVIKSQSFTSVKPLFSIVNITKVNGNLDDALNELGISENGLMDEISDISIKIGEVYLDISKKLLNVEN
ncbi:hypothetical protein [Vibrio crassostreae]|uniref:hypothetical protein n=1 Tax=Vibrio crassostreae TaxID=246167 RepID=UPI0010520351|nr:hypothetical protein [Vibrio crassostreae]TCW20215.1 hypothetical protein EDB48_104161 [Vibrio crassostreae]CAK3844176.1 membrane hypothetical protein [Vibrio crassostreae]